MSTTHQVLLTINVGLVLVNIVLAQWNWRKGSRHMAVMCGLVGAASGGIIMVLLA